MNNKPTPSSALGSWALTVAVLYVVASLFSFSFNDWNWFSRIIFWAPTVILGVWTLNDYFINPNS